MIFFTDKKLCYLANTKCGSTTVEKSIPVKRSQVRFNISPFKHANRRQFQGVLDQWPRWQNQHVETVCTVRHPLDRAKSWYKYRTRDKIQSSNRYTGEMTFEEYLLAAIEAGREKSLSNLGFVSDSEGKVAVDHIFTYENMDGLFNFLRERTGLKISFKDRNVSPKREDITASSEVVDLFLSVYAEEVEWYDSLLRKAA